MGNKKIAIASFAILVVVAAGATTRGLVAQSGPVILTSPVETPGQFSYGFADPSAPSDGQWVAIDFHRDPHCPELAGFNLLMFGDFPNALSCPLTVDVKEWWNESDLAVSGGPWQSPPWSPNFRTPSQARWLGKGSVPIYFVNLLEYLDALGDAVLTVSELESLPSLLIGYATQYQYVQLNSGRANSFPTLRDGHSQTVAHGVLNDGRSFQFYRNTQGPDAVTSYKIDFIN
jgi:hypothetical protein